MFASSCLYCRVCSFVVVCAVLAAQTAPKHATTAVKKHAEPQGPADFIQKRLDAAQAAQQAGDLIRTESEYRQALGVALEQLGQAYHALGDLDQAEAAYLGAVKATANSDAALLGLAVVYLRKGEFQKG